MARSISDQAQAVQCHSKMQKSFEDTWCSRTMQAVVLEVLSMPVDRA